MKIILLLCAALFCAALPLSAQEMPERSSIHRIESESHSDDTLAMNGSVTAPARPAEMRPLLKLSSRVFGYHPYWSTATAHTLYDYEALSTIGYFSYEVDSATGSYSSIHGWSTAPVVDYAHARGVKVVLVVTSFGYDANDAILTNVSRQQTMIDSLISLLRARDGDGVNIDFELVRATQRANLVSFMIRLATQVRAAIPGAEISMATPAVDWNNAFDLPALADLCDYLILMGYDYHWSSAPTAGPVAPIVGESYNVTRSVDTYLATGMPPSKLLLAVPWYGYDWQTADSVPGSTTIGSGRAVYYGSARANAARFGKRYDETTRNPWYMYTANGLIRQAWYDDSLSLAEKYMLAKEKGLGGIGIWALGYEEGAAEIWNGISAAFALPSSVADHPENRKSAMFIPNPTTGIGSIAIFSAGRSDATLRVLDILGRPLRTLPVTLDEGVNRIELDLSDLPQGAYHFTIQNGSDLFHGRIRIIR